MRSLRLEALTQQPIQTKSNSAQIRRMRRRSALLAIAAAVSMCTPIAHGATSLLDLNGTAAGFGGSGTSDLNGSFWTSDTTGITAPVVFPIANLIQIGSVASDFAGASITLNMDNGVSLTANPGGINIVSNSATVFLAGTANCRWNHAFTWTVASGSTMNVTNTGNNGGWNFNSFAATLAGGGIIDFKDNFGANENAAGGVTENMPGGTVKLEQTATSNYGNSAGGFTLTNGNLQFVSPQSLADTFQAFAAASKFSVNGGTIDNLTGAAGTISLGSGVYSFGGSFTFAGSNDLSLGANAVTLTGTRQITVAAKTLTINGAIGDSGSAFGINKAGTGTLILGGNNNYTGPTTVNNGALMVTGSLASSNLVLNNASNSITIGGTGDGVSRAYSGASLCPPTSARMSCT